MSWIRYARFCNLNYLLCNELFNFVSLVFRSNEFYGGFVGFDHTGDIARLE